MTEPRCHFCGEPVDVNRLTYRRIDAWHRPGKAGGSDVALRRETGEVAHPWCVDRERAGVHPNQEVLA